GLPAHDVATAAELERLILGQWRSRGDSIDLLPYQTVPSVAAVGNRATRGGANQLISCRPTQAQPGRNHGCRPPARDPATDRPIGSAWAANRLCRNVRREVI